MSAKDKIQFYNKTETKTIPEKTKSMTGSITESRLSGPDLRNEIVSASSSETESDSDTTSSETLDSASAMSSDRLRTSATDSEVESNLDTDSAELSSNVSSNENLETTSSSDSETESFEFEYVSQEVVSEGVNCDNGEDINDENIKTEDISTQEIDTEDIKTEDIKTEDNSTEYMKTEDIKTADIDNEDIKTAKTSEDMRFELESEFDEGENWNESDDNDLNLTEAESICKNNGNQELNDDHENTENDNTLTSLKDINLETFHNHEGDQINLQSERKEISPSFESNRGAGDSPRRSTSKKKCVFAIGSVLMFIGSLRPVFELLKFLLEIPVLSSEEFVTEII